jgi:hypothetical protein
MLFAGVATGNAISDMGDPSEIGGGGPPVSHIGGSLFSFLSSTGTSPGTSACVINGVNDSVCDFVNVSGQTWSSLVWTILPGEPLTSCQFTIGFTNCVVNQQGDATTPSIITFFGGAGILNTQAFGVAAVGWAPNTSFSLAANVPEPTSFVLLMAGLAALAARRATRRSLLTRNRADLAA